jgi:hypothetical protein
LTIARSSSKGVALVELRCEARAARQPVGESVAERQRLLGAVHLGRARRQAQPRHQGGAVGIVDPVAELQLRPEFGVFSAVLRVSIGADGQQRQRRDGRDAPHYFAADLETTLTQPVHRILKNASQA